MNDIAYVQLPSGQDFILSIYSTAYEPDQPGPYDGSNLGIFAEYLIEELGLLNAPCTPPIFKYSISDPHFSILSGSWTQNSANDAYNGEYLMSGAPGDSVSWSMEIPSSGLYEVCIWSPQSVDFSNGALVQVLSNNIVYNYTLSQEYYGGRWYKLGDFYMDKGQQNNIVAIQQLPNSQPVVASAIKISKWPECHHSPGALCTDIDPKLPVCENELLSIIHQ